MITKFLHTGFRVTNLDEAIKLYEKLGFTLKRRFDKPKPKAKAAHMSSKNGYDIELWQFLDSDHPQVEYIQQHLAVASDNLEADINDLIKKGCELVIPITKGVVLTYAFVRDPSGNYLEIAKQ